MKTILLFASIALTTATMAQDTTELMDMKALQMELAENAELPDCSFLPCAKDFYVNLQGEVVLVTDQVTEKNDLMTSKDLEVSRKADFLFESHTGDRYYLVN